MPFLNSLSGQNFSGSAKIWSSDMKELASIQMNGNRDTSAARTRRMIITVFEKRLATITPSYSSGCAQYFFT